MRLISKFGVSVLLLCSAQGAMADAWDQDNDPSNMVPGFDSRFSAAPLQSELPESKIPWDEIYWPTVNGGIAYRWNSPDPQILKFKSPSLQQLRYMSEDQIAQLSPAEKYDVYVGDYSYPTVEDQFSRKKPWTGSWSGICDGWSASALNYPEPGQVVLTNADGIRIPFGSSDIKALLSFNYAEREFRPSPRVGTECTRWKSRYSSYCKDVNAGAFHVVITNKIGLHQEGFAAEVDPSSQVWNQPIYKYEFRVLQSGVRPRSGSAHGTASESLIELEMTYPQDDRTDDGVVTVPHMYPTKGTPDYRKTTKTYRYWLELDYADHVIGGEWDSKDHPDFLWSPNTVTFEGYYSRIGEIYERSRASH